MVFHGIVPCAVYPELISGQSVHQWIVNEAFAEAYA